ncbi:MAG: WbqC family protein [Rhodospirillaceae bacterium]|mgnify:CR=1 FL=1|nr:WbqC family protein [Rhodospirillales bacterium]MBT3627016.1 WbqC family protein [Rhodospirillaceae bacterium]MBT3927140.1 WbqC family protein [Rhodospirillaceae bacterium]MBT4428079.1 WbqC family protein [Rhodospirillaceae bacterium]MBT5038298.1 WbqC family protein [Rhodospirillaceae bacterium]
MTIRVTIHQPNYLPWLGYFEKALRTDVFIFFDNVQMPMNKSFVTRNRIKGSNGPQWLTVPVLKSSETKPIAEAKIADALWHRKHLRTLRTVYQKSPWCDAVIDRLSPIMESDHTNIADLNCALVKEINSILGLNGRTFLRASEMDLVAQGAESIFEILEKTRATIYLTGQGTGSQRHLDADKFSDMGVAIEYMSIEFPEYAQEKLPFEPRLSIIDALMNIGPEEVVEILKKGR